MTTDESSRSMICQTVPVRPNVTVQMTKTYDSDLDEDCTMIVDSDRDGFDGRDRIDRILIVE